MPPKMGAGPPGKEERRSGDIPAAAAAGWWAGPRAPAPASTGWGGVQGGSRDRTSLPGATCCTGNTHSSECTKQWFLSGDGLHKRVAVSSVGTFVKSAHDLHVIKRTALQVCAKQCEVPPLAASIQHTI
jgi:hypothetical protein